MRFSFKFTGIVHIGSCRNFKWTAEKKEKCRNKVFFLFLPSWWWSFNSAVSVSKQAVRYSIKHGARLKDRQCIFNLFFKKKLIEMKIIKVFICHNYVGRSGQTENFESYNIYLYMFEQNDILASENIFK